MLKTLGNPQCRSQPKHRMPKNTGLRCAGVTLNYGCLRHLEIGERESPGTSGCRRHPHPRAKGIIRNVGFPESPTTPGCRSQKQSGCWRYSDHRDVGFTRNSGVREPPGLRGTGVSRKSGLRDSLGNWGYRRHSEFLGD